MVLWLIHIFFSSDVRISLFVDSSSRRKVKREKRPRIDWPVKPTHSRRAAAATAAPGENVIGCGKNIGEIQ